MIIEKLKTLKTLLSSNELILTGSTALAYHGLLKMDEAKDLDLLILNPSDTTKEVLNRLQADYPSSKWREGSPVSHSFIYEGVKVDVWFLTCHEDAEYLTTSDGVQVSSIGAIVNAKLSIGRSKDWIQLMQLSKRIFDPAKFEAQLPNIANHSEDYESTTNGAKK